MWGKLSQSAFCDLAKNYYQHIHLKWKFFSPENLKDKLGSIDFNMKMVNIFLVLQKPLLHYLISLSKRNFFPVGLWAQDCRPEWVMVLGESRASSQNTAKIRSIKTIPTPTPPTNSVKEQQWKHLAKNISILLKNWYVLWGYSFIIFKIQNKW